MSERRATPHRVQVLVMAHPRRKRHAEYLAHTLHGNVVLDPDPHGTPSALRTFAKCLALQCSNGQRYTHALVIQDDALPHAQLLSVLPDIVARHPNDLTCLYVGSSHAGRKLLLGGYKRGRRYTKLPLKHFVPTVASIWPTRLAADFMIWLSLLQSDQVRAQDDEMVMDWRIHRYRAGQPVIAWATIPSLVAHDNGLPSILNPTHDRLQRAALMSTDEWGKSMPWETGW